MNQVVILSKGSNYISGSTEYLSFVEIPSSEVKEWVDILQDLFQNENAYQINSMGILFIGPISDRCWNLVRKLGYLHTVDSKEIIKIDPFYKYRNTCVFAFRPFVYRVGNFQGSGPFGPYDFCRSITTDVVLE